MQSSLKSLRNKALIFSILFFNSQILLAIETARVLPKGIFRARLATVRTGSITDTYNSSGQLTPIAGGLNQSVTVDTLAASEPALGQLRDALNNLSPGLGQELMAANIYSDFDAQVAQFVPALEYGLTSKLSLGIRIPVVQRDIRTSMRVDGVNNSAAIAATMGTLSPALTAGLQQASATTLNTRFFESALFTSKGYQSPNGRIQGTELGDVEVGAAYNFFKSEKVMATTQLGFRLPTGTMGELDNFFDSGVGEGSLSFGAYFFEEYNPTDRIMLSAAQKFEYHFSDTRRRAVPLNPGDSIPSILDADGQVQDVTRTRGLQFMGELGATTYMYDRSVQFWAATQYETEGSASYSGPGDLYYEGLGADSFYQYWGGEIGFKYSTLRAFVNKKASIPYEFSLQYNRKLSGQNVSMSSYGRADLVVYF